ncbi:MAG: hypothetical protein WC329_08545, partial [Candidatus Omnitrophota bacterium]
MASCTANSSKNCFDNDVYWYDSCGNRGAVYDDCGSAETCSNAACVADNCTANSSKNCYNSDVYWYDSCGNRGAVYDDCGSDETCSAGECGASS